jgi:hypothetical protein
MGAARGLSGFIGKLQSFVTARRSSEEFTCGDCSKWEHCGLPPSDDCLAKAAQIEERGRRPLARSLLLGWSDLPPAKP